MEELTVVVVDGSPRHWLRLPGVSDPATPLASFTVITCFVKSRHTDTSIGLPVVTRSDLDAEEVIGWPRCSNARRMRLSLAGLHQRVWSSGETGLRRSRVVVDKIADLMRDHYSAAFRQHGPTSRGVDWGDREWAHWSRIDRMIDVARLPGHELERSPTILDVGCGYGALAERLRDVGLDWRCVGVELSQPMVDHARTSWPDHEWLVGDFLELELPECDFVVCNGVLTQKLTASRAVMHRYALDVVRKMHGLARVGIAFNLMTTRVNYMVDNLFYVDPLEMLGWCISEFSSPVALNDAYLPFEYTVYVYRSDAHDRWNSSAG